MPIVRVNVWTLIKYKLLFNPLITTLFNIESTLITGWAFIFTPLPLTIDTLPLTTIYKGNTIYNQPPALNLSFNVIVNTYKLWPFTNKDWGLTPHNKEEALAFTLALPIIFWNPFLKIYTMIKSLSFVEGGAVIVLKLITIK